jgi:hypothetical protein
VPDLQKLQTMAARFAPTEIGADLSKLSDTDRRVLAKLVEASKIVDALFLRQVWAGNDAMLLDLVRDSSPLGRERLHNFLINKGPWSRLDHNQAFVPGAPPKPVAANFYPEGATKAEIERWIQAAPRGGAQPRHRLLHGDPPRRQHLQPRAYSTEYQGELARAAALLREAAARRDRSPTLKTSRPKRAGAFLLRTTTTQRRRRGWSSKGGTIEPTDRPVRGLRGSVQTTSGFERSSPAPATSESQSSSGSRVGASRTSRNHLPIDAEVPQPKIGGLAADRSSSTRSSRRRREPRRPDRRLQPARTTSASSGKKRRQARPC